MIGQDDLFGDVGAARSDDPETAKRAALEAPVQSLQLAILDVLATVSDIPGSIGCDSKEIAEKIGVGRDSISPRMKMMLDRGWVRIVQGLYHQDRDADGHRVGRKRRVFLITREGLEERLKRHAEG